VNIPCTAQVETFSRRVVTLRLAGKLLTTKDAVRLVLDGLGTFGSFGINWGKGCYTSRSRTDNRIAHIHTDSNPSVNSRVLYHWDESRRAAA
jgi:hypothetical protein